MKSDRENNEKQIWMHIFSVHIRNGYEYRYSYYKVLTGRNIRYNWYPFPFSSLLFLLSNAHFSFVNASNRALVHPDERCEWIPPASPRAPAQTRASYCGRVPSVCHGPCRGLCHRRSPHCRPPCQSIAFSSNLVSSSVSTSLYFRPNNKFMLRLKTHVASFCFKCFRYMLQMFLMVLQK
jgi:hypothetical protein